VVSGPNAEHGLPQGDRTEKPALSKFEQQLGDHRVLVGSRLVETLAAIADPAHALTEAWERQDLVGLAQAADALATALKFDLSSGARHFAREIDKIVSLRMREHKDAA
jgi:hypothetical protein